MYPLNPSDGPCRGQCESRCGCGGLERWDFSWRSDCEAAQRQTADRPAVASSSYSIASPEVGVKRTLFKQV